MTAISAATRFAYDFADGSREMRVMLGSNVVQADAYVLSREGVVWGELDPAHGAGALEMLDYLALLERLL